MAWSITGLFFAVLLLSPVINAGKTLHLTLTPTEVSSLPQSDTAAVVIHASTANANLRYIYVESLEEDIARVTGDSRFPISPEPCNNTVLFQNSLVYKGTNANKILAATHIGNVNAVTDVNASARVYRCFNATFYVTGISLGKTSLAVYVGEQSLETPDTISNLIHENYRVSVVRVRSDVRVVLHWCLIGTVVLTIFCLSAKVDFSDIVQTVKRPKALCLTFALMFIFKPLFSYALGTVFTIDKTLRLGVFALGSCPEGAVSLIWTHILGGNLALALLISCGEAILSFGAIPLSMITLGNSILGQDTTIPFKDIAMNSAEVLTACAAGVMVRTWAPEVVSMKVGRAARFIGTFTLLLLIFVNIYCNRDVFGLMGEWRVLACGTLLPGLGGLLGGIVAWACCKEWKSVKAITLAVILQGIEVPVAIINATLPPTDAQLAGIVPVIAALFANTALWPPCLIRYMKQGCGIQEDVIIHTTNTTMSMKKKKFRAMFVLETTANPGNPGA